MRLRTLAGDVIDLAFHWAPGSLHVGRQAARLHAQRVAEIVTMRSDPAKAGGWETLVKSDLRDGGRMRVDTYEIVPPLTDVEKAIPKGELFIRDPHAPMTNTRSDRTGVTYKKTFFDPSDDRACAIRDRFEAAITAALNNEHT